MPLTIFRRGKVWHYRGTVAGRLLRGSTGTADKRTAQRIAAEREAREWKGRLDGPASVLTFANAAHLYLDAGKTARYIGEVAAYWRDMPVAEITSGAVQRAAIALFPNASGATKNRCVIVPTQAVINFAAESELCPPLRVRRFPVVKKEKRPADWPWIETFMAHASPHLGALACFMFLTGARVGEAVAMTWEDVDLPKARATIRQTKIGVERVAHLPPVLVAALANIGERSPYNSKPVNDRVFGYMSRHSAEPVWASVVKRADLPPLSFHACRHGFATAMLRAGVDPVTVAKLGGWKSPAQLFATYGHAMDDPTLVERIIGTPSAQTQPPIKNRSSKATG